jgi:hypothetical protein
MKNQKIINLLDQILEQAKEDDAIHKAKNRQSKAMSTIGDSWYVFHLTLLKGLLEEESDPKNKKVEF